MDIYSPKKRTEIMSRIRSKDSKVEVSFRKLFWDSKLRYRKNSAQYFGKPDMVLKKYKTVIFLDSCFWHGCKTHGSLPKTRKKFWSNKIQRNIERDVEVGSFYRKIGWKIFRVWEHDMKKNPQKVVKKIKSQIY